MIYPSCMSVRPNSDNVFYNNILNRGPNDPYPVEMPWGPTPSQDKGGAAVNLFPPAHPFTPIPSDHPKNYTQIMKSQSFVISFSEETNGHMKIIARKTLRLPPNDNQYGKEEVNKVSISSGWPLSIVSISILFLKRIRRLIILLKSLRHPNICQAMRLVTNNCDGAIVIEVPFYNNIMDYNRQNPHVNKVTQVILIHYIPL